MTHKINYNRRQFLQHSVMSAAALSLFPQTILAKTGKVNNKPTPSFKADVEIEFSSKEAYIPIFKGNKTQVQKYYARVLKGPKNTVVDLDNNYLGPTLNYIQGQKVRIYYTNKLLEPSIIHWHGMHVPQHSDGHPMYMLDAGETLVYEFEVLNPAGTNFYHSHSHELTGSQVYRGLAGLITVTDDEEQKLGLPQGEYDLPFVLQDRHFNQRNQLEYIHGMHDRMQGFVGDTIMVNGTPNAEFSVKTRAYRFRVVNGSNSRIYKLAWDDGTPLTAIGTDGNLLPQAETRPYIMLGPAERVDLWLDFSGRAVGSQLTMVSLDFEGAAGGMGGGMMGGRGMMGGGSGLKQGDKFAIARFKVSEKVSDSPKLPTVLSQRKALTVADVDNSEAIPIALSMRPMQALINGKSFAMDRVSDAEKVALGSIKKIKIFHDHNRGGRMGGMLSMAHPIHLHGQQFQILSRRMTGRNERDYATVKEGFIDSGRKDTVLVMPGEEITIAKPFEDFKGLFLYHCHNLEHEDLGMMRQFYVS